MFLSSYNILTTLFALSYSIHSSAFNWNLLHDAKLKMYLLNWSNCPCYNICRFLSILHYNIIIIILIPRHAKPQILYDVIIVHSYSWLILKSLVVVSMILFLVTFLGYFWVCYPVSFFPVSCKHKGSPTQATAYRSLPAFL